MGRSSGTEPIVLARLRRAWGRRGELLADVHTDWPEERFRSGARVELLTEEGLAGELVVSGFRDVAAGGLISFEGIGTIEEAEEFEGAWLAAPSGSLPEMEPGAVHRAQLVGLTVVDRDEAVLGRVEQLVEGAGQDRLSVRLCAGTVVEIPFVEAICREIDLERGLLTVELPEGLTDPSRAAAVPPEGA
jgi:16S rRNA processing protein RimM